MKKFDTFSAHSLKILEKNLDEFKDKFIYNLSLYKKDNRAVLGQKFHALICYYINNFNVDKMINSLDEKEKIVWQNLEKILKDERKYFIFTEYPFLIKEDLDGWNYYLTGRFDAIYKKDVFYIIYDWKTLNLPKNPSYDLQSVVYLYCASKIFNTKNIKMRYLSLEKLDIVEIDYLNDEKYKERIEKIIQKLFQDD